LINYIPPIGQEKVISYFENAKSNNKMSAAYILEGESGIGKKEIAKYLSLLVMCNEDKPCLKCEKCTYTLAGTNPDIIVISNEDKASVGVEKVRDIIQEAYVLPKVSNKKLFIIENAHLMTHGAQNCILKVLEEPPEYVMFLLLCEKIDLLLPTIRSRSVVVSVKKLSKENLSKITGCKDEFLLEYSGGRVGKLTSLLNDENFVILRNSFFDKMKLLLGKNESDLYKIYDFLDENKESKDLIFEMLTSFFRDVLFYKNLCEEFVINKDKTEYILLFSEKLSLKNCQKICEIIFEIQTQMGKYGGYSVNIHTMLIKIWEEIYG